MRMRTPFIVACLVGAFGLAAASLAAEPPKKAAAPPAAAAHAMPGNLADFWTFWPKAGHEAQFEAAVKTHLAWRKQAGEGWTWEAYQPVVGTDLTRFVFRCGERRWADFDAQEAWDAANKAGEAFNRDVAPHLERYEHSIEEEDYAVSHWVDGPDYRYFSVQTHKIKAGANGTIHEATAAIHKALQAGGWPGSYAIAREVSGSGAFKLAFPYTSYAAMEEPKPGFMEVLAKGAGSAEAAQALMQKFDGAIESVDTTVYVTRPDLSTQK